ncbi:MAG: hypothetical protein P8Y37_09415, partial [Anaerolineales bacterium]
EVARAAEVRAKEAAERAQVRAGRAQERAEDLGIELIDLRLKRINYVEEVQKDVFDRMIAERNRIAQRFRSEGQGEAVFNLVLGVRNVTDLRRTLDLLERINNVYEARRVRSV